MVTSLSKSSFKLSSESKQLPDCFFLLSEYGVRNGTKIYLSVGIQCGQGMENLTPARRIFTRHVYSMSPQDVKDSFEAKHTVHILLRDADGIAALIFFLDNPMNQQPNYYTQKGRNVEVVSGFNVLRCGHPPKKSGPEVSESYLPLGVFNGRGVPGKTVDTLVSLLDAFLEMRAAATFAKDSQARTSSS